MNDESMKAQDVGQLFARAQALSQEAEIERRGAKEAANNANTATKAAVNAWNEFSHALLKVNTAEFLQSDLFHGDALAKATKNTGIAVTSAKGSK